MNDGAARACMLEAGIGLNHRDPGEPQPVQQTVNLTHGLARTDHSR
jgi:hypothetical protein